MLSEHWCMESMGLFASHGMDGSMRCAYTGMRGVRSGRMPRGVAWCSMALLTVSWPPRALLRNMLRQLCQRPLSFMSCGTPRCKKKRRSGGYLHRSECVYHEQVQRPTTCKLVHTYTLPPNRPAVCMSTLDPHGVRPYTGAQITRGQPRRSFLSPTP